jgi:hypothetical protein
MTTKVFCHLNEIQGYVQGETTAQDTFGLSITYQIFRSDEYTNSSGNYTLAFPLSWNPLQFYGSLYEELVNVCTSNEWEIPKKSDVFCFVPITMDQMLPEIPTFA